MATEKKLSFAENVTIMEPKEEENNNTGSSNANNGTAAQNSGQNPSNDNSDNSSNLERPSDGYFANKHHHSNHHHQHHHQSSHMHNNKNTSNTAGSPSTRNSNATSSRTPSGTYAPVRTPTTPGGTAVKDPQQAQYLAQERAYLQKIRNDLWDDYYARGLSPVSSVDTMESESDDEDNEEEEEDPEGLRQNGGVAVGLGGVGTSFDDEYTDLGSSYPFFLEASYEDFDNPENLKERLEWQAMLSSVLTGEVVRSEKRRLKAPTNDNKIQEDDLWIGIRAKVCGRTVSEQKRVLDYARSSVNDVLEGFLTFRITYQDDDDVSLESASAQVEDMIEKIEKCESLWRSKLAMRQENKIYGSEQFQLRMEALISWNTITHSINKELDLLRKWTGNNDLDPTRPPDNSRSDSQHDAVDEKSSLVENILKQDDLTQVFDLRIKQSIGPLIKKAREATVEYSEVYVDLGLPLFHERLSHLMSFPIKLIQEIIRMRLIYARRLVNPTMMIVDQTISDFQLYIQIGLSIMENNRAYTDPIFDKGWVFPNHVDETFNATVLDCMKFYLELLHSKYLDSVKVYKSYQTFKETEQLEQQYNFLKDIGRLIDGGDILVAEQFSSLESKMLARLLGYWEQQMKGPLNMKNPSEVERWFASAIENVRSFQRKLLRFYK